MTKITQGLWNLGVNTLSRTNLIPSAGRVKMLRSFGFRIGEGSSVRSRCYFRSANVIIGEKSWINNECFFDNKSNCRVSLGNHCAARVLQSS
jgi:acetyltransferase-like isoleucine patch superfamily enzyme